MPRKNWFCLVVLVVGGLMLGSSSLWGGEQKIALDFTRGRGLRELTQKLEKEVSLYFNQTPFYAVIQVLQDKIKVPVVLQVGQERFNIPFSGQMEGVPAWFALQTLCSQIDVQVRFAEGAVYVEGAKSVANAATMVCLPPPTQPEVAVKSEPLFRVRFVNGTEIAMQSESLLKRDGLTEMLIARALPELAPASGLFVGKLSKEHIESKMIEQIKKAVQTVAGQASVAVDPLLGIIMIQTEKANHLERVELLMSSLGVVRENQGGRELTRLSAWTDGVPRISSKEISDSPPSVKQTQNPGLPPQIPDQVVHVDGSSTVLPFALALKKLFLSRYPNAKIRVMGEEPGETPAGSGGGFRKFFAQEVEVANASRSMNDKERKVAQQQGLEYLELPIAFDGISVVVPSQNRFCEHLTVKELQAIWSPGSKVTHWKQVRAGFPEQPLRLFAPGTDSGTFDYFTEAIVGKAKAARNDLTASEDDEVLAKEIMDDPNAMGFFGLSYVATHKDRLRSIGIDNGQGPVWPSNETVSSGTYVPLSRPLFIYVNRKALERPEVNAWVTFFLQQSKENARTIGCIPLNDEVHKKVWEWYCARATGPFPLRAGR